MPSAGFRSASYGAENEQIAGVWGGGGWIWDAVTGKVVLAFAPPGTRLGRVSLAPGGVAVAATTQDGELRVWREGQADLIIPSLGMDVAVAWSPDGSGIATGNAAGTVTVWEPSSGVRVRELKEDSPGRGFDTAVRALAWHPSESKIAVADDSGDLKLWSLDAARAEKLAVTPSTVFSMSFSPDGRCLAVVGQRGYAAILRLAVKRDITTLAGHTDTLSVASFSQDSRYLATAGRDRAVRLWEVRTGKLEQVYLGLKAQIYTLGFTSDGTRLVACDGDGAIARWRLGSGGPDSVIQRVVPAYASEEKHMQAHRPSARWYSVAENIRWSDLRCGCGNSGSHIPGDLAKLLSAQTDQQARGRGLVGHIEEQGMLFEVSVPAAKVLLAALEEDMSDAARFQVLSFLLGLVSGESHHSEVVNGRPDLEVECQHAVSEHPGALYEELREERVPGGSEYALEILRCAGEDRDSLLRIQGS